MIMSVIYALIGVLVTRTLVPYFTRRGRSKWWALVVAFPILVVIVLLVVYVIRPWLDPTA